MTRFLSYAWQRKEVPFLFEPARLYGQQKGTSFILYGMLYKTIYCLMDTSLISSFDTKNLWISS